MSISASSAILASTPTSPFVTATSSVDYASIFGSSTSTSVGAAYTGSEEYAVFPNGVYLSKFYLVSSQDSGLTHLDIDLYNYCYLPYGPLPYDDLRKRTPQYSGDPRPDYLLDRAPCRRAASINTNCDVENTNGSLAGIRPSEQPDAQKECYCEKYPYFDSTLGCMECFRQHGGIEGYHWFPQSYVAAVSSSYCGASPQSTGFYDFAREWASTDAAAKIPSMTAENVLGTQTAASLYYTYAAAATTADSQNAAVRITDPRPHFSAWNVLIATMSLLLACGIS